MLIAILGKKTKKPWDYPAVFCMNINYFQSTWQYQMPRQLKYYQRNHRDAIVS